MTAQRWSVMSRFSLWATDPYGIIPVYAFCALNFSVHVQLLLIAVFLFSLSLILSRVSLEIHSSSWCLLQLRTYWYIEVNASLILCQLFSIVVFSSLNGSRKALNRLLRIILNPLSLLLCRRRLYWTFWMLFLQLFSAFLTPVSCWQSQIRGNLKLSQSLSWFSHLPLIFWNF